jgi:hypothetical protein
MNAKAKLPKISKQAAAEIAGAARKAYGNRKADKFLDCIFEHSRADQTRLREIGEQTRTE